MEKFAGYGFNKSHAAPYALIAYQTAWLKANAPVEFFAASMSLDISNTDKLAVFYQDAKRFGVTIRAAGRQPLRRRLRGRGRRGALCPGRDPQRRPGRPWSMWSRCARRAGRSATCSTSSSGSIRGRSTSARCENLARAGAFDAIHPNRAQIVAGRRRPDRLRPERGGRARLGAGQPVRRRPGRRGAPAAAQDATAGRRPSSWTRSWRRSASTCPATRWTTWSRRCAAGAPTCSPTPWPRPRRARRPSAWPASCAAGRSAPRPGSGEKFAFVTLSDPTGEYEVLFPPEALRRCRDAAGAGRGGGDQGARQGRGRRGALLRRRAPSRSSKAVENVAAGLRVHLSPRSAEIEALKKRLDGADRAGRRRDHPGRRRRRGPRGRAETARPLHPRRRRARRAQDRAGRGLRRGPLEA